jgi:hypothetical protein
MLLCIYVVFFFSQFGMFLWQNPCHTDGYVLCYKLAGANLSPTKQLELAVNEYDVLYLCLSLLLYYLKFAIG